MRRMCRESVRMRGLRTHMKTVILRYSLRGSNVSIVAINPKGPPPGGFHVTVGFDVTKHSGCQRSLFTDDLHAAPM